MGSLDDIYGNADIQKEDLKKILGQGREYDPDAEEEEIPETISTEEEEIPEATFIKTNDEYLEMARWLLVGFDAFMAMGQSKMSGEPFESLKRVITTSGEETKSLANILEKRSVKLTPEGVFFVTMIVIYAPRFYMSNMAANEKKAKSEAAEKSENDKRRRHNEERLRNAGIDPTTVFKA